MTKPSFLPNRVYDILKFIALILLPATGSAYFGLAQIWGFPNAEEVVGTIAVIETFLGLVLGFSTKSYNSSDAKYAGVIMAGERDDGTTVFNLNVNKEDPKDIKYMNEVLFKVERTNN